MQNQNQQAPRAPAAGQAGAQPPAAGAPQPAAPKSKTARVKFLSLWSSSFGYFAPGRVAEFPASIADSLIKENVAEPSSAEISEK